METNSEPSTGQNVRCARYAFHMATDIKSFTGFFVQDILASSPMANRLFEVHKRLRIRSKY